MGFIFGQHWKLFETKYLCLIFKLDDFNNTISNLIRPGSLAVRLAANMIAGHMLMSLLGNNSNNISLLLILIIQVMLMLFETAVALIQAYVFSMLGTLYASEVM